MLTNCCCREPYVDTRSWYKKLWIHVSMRAKWNWPITRHIYAWWSHRYSKQFRGVMLPVMKTTFAPFDAKEFVNVQPMKELPPGVTFPMDFVYEQKKPWYQFWK